MEATPTAAFRKSSAALIIGRWATVSDRSSCYRSEWSSRSGHFGAQAADRLGGYCLGWLWAIARHSHGSGQRSQTGLKRYVGIIKRQTADKAGDYSTSSNSDNRL